MLARPRPAVDLRMPSREFQQESASRQAPLSDVDGIFQAWPVNNNEAEFYRYGGWWDKRVELAEPMHKLLAASFPCFYFGWYTTAEVMRKERGTLLHHNNIFTHAAPSSPRPR